MAEKNTIMIKKNNEETEQKFKLICTNANDGNETFPVIVGGAVKDGKWVDPYDFTSEAIEAVRDYLISQIKEGDKGSGYQWKRTDGTCAKLMLTIEDEDVNEATSEAPTDEAEVHEDAGELAE